MVFILLNIVLAAVLLPSTTRMIGKCSVVNGTVVELLAQSHGSVTYTYIVDGTSYKHTDVPDRQVHIGDSIKVFFLKKNPSVSIIEEPRERSIGICMNNLMLSAFFSLMTIFPPRSHNTLPRLIFYR